MPAVFQPSTSPAKVDLASANSRLFRDPSTISASSSLYSLSVSRKRPRRNTEKLPSKFEASSPSPLLESDYRRTSGSDGYHASAELDYRPNRYRESFLPPSLESSVESISHKAQGTSRKRSRRDSCVVSPSADGESDTPARVGWGRAVINAVGKVLDLCWSGAFRGFHSGGGKGYDMSAGSPTQFNTSWQSPAASSAEKDLNNRTPIPGQFPEDEIERSWVVIPTEPTDPFVSNNSAGSPSLRARRVHQASSPRRRPAVMPRLHKATTSSWRPSTPSKSPGLASPRSRDGPGSADVQRYAAQLRRKEREEDASIRRLNKQLQAMIREGKEALGTTVEVDDLEMDCD